MKKLLCGALMLLTAATAFVGCDKDKNKVITSITLNKSELTLAEGASQRLSVSANDKLQGTYTWASSDEQVATVDKYGTVTAQNIGTATITVTETTSKQTATCAVKVVSEMETINFTQATVAYYNGNDYLATLDTIDSVFIYTDDAGEKHPLRAFLVNVDVDFFSDGFYINDDGDYDGASEGYIAHFPAQAYYAPKGMNDDRGFTGAAMIPTGVWSTQLKAVSHLMEAGYLDNEAEAFEHINAAFNYANGQDWDMYHQEMGMADTMAFKGGQIRKYTYNAREEYYTTVYFPAAIVNACAAKLAWNDASNYMYNVPAIEMYFNVLGGGEINGIEYEMNEISEEMTLLSDKFIIDNSSIHYKRVDETEESAPARMIEKFSTKIRTSRPSNVRMK